MSMQPHLSDDPVLADDFWLKLMAKTQKRPCEWSPETWADYEEETDDHERRHSEPA